MISSYFDDLTIMRGNTDIPSKRPIHLLNRDYWCLQYNHSGNISVRIDDRSPVQVIGPSLLITEPGHNYIFGNHEGWHHNYLAFSGSRVTRYVQTGFLPSKDCIVSIRDGHEFLSRMKECLRALHLGKLIEASHLFEGLLMELHQGERSGEDDPMEKGIQDLVLKIRERPELEWDLRTEAETLHLSHVHLRRLLKKATGQAPGQFQLDGRLKKAADLLTGTYSPIKQIAAECGLENIHYFSRVFSRKYGLPPGKFRRKFLGG